MATVAAKLLYEVPDMELVVQDKDMACWFASAMMLILWKERNRSGTTCEMIDDSTINLYKANNGIQNHQILPLAKRLGLEPIAPLCPNVDALDLWLRTHGPLWTNGTRHITVIAGIRGSDAQGYEVKVYDPWPGEGVSWRTLSGWYTGFDPGTHAASARDESVDVRAVFLHVP